MNANTDALARSVPSALIDLSDKLILVVGVANEHSIAYGAARAFRAAGARLAMTYQTPKTAEFTRPLAEQLGVELFEECDLTNAAQVDALFDKLAARYGRLDGVMHSVAFAPREDLHGRLVDSSAEGFARAMDVSCHSFVRLAQRAEPLMTAGGTILAVSYMGAERAVQHYGIMGPVKAALESSVRYLADELGPRNISVVAVSPGPIPTRAASGIAGFDELVRNAQEHAPMHRLVTLDEIGATCAFLMCPYGRSQTGSTIYVDAGHHVIAQ